MKKFEVGKTYTMGFIGDSELFVDYTVVDRTECTVKVKDQFGKVKTCRISKHSECFGEETVYPCGRYSMCPALHA